jgi:DNA-binding transcriptional MerR regulator
VEKAILAIGGNIGNFNKADDGMKTTGQVVEEIGITRQKLYYLEQKGFVEPLTEQRGEKLFRYYSQSEVEKIRLIWKYWQQGFRYRVAYQKALRELESS